MQISTEEFKEFRDFLQVTAGINLADNKQYLVSTRIRKILSENQMQTVGELTRAVKTPTNKRLRQAVVDAMTTNETFWFRDLYPFDYLRHQLLPEYAKQGRSDKIRIWSAACSSGQEPYSISMAVEEFIRDSIGHSHLPVDIVSTDLSSQVLEKAKQGLYDRLSIGRGLSSERLREFFTETSEGWQVKDSLRRRVTFLALNLLDPYRMLGRFDIVFCRNVLIYFSSELKQDILRRIHATMKPGACLFLGSSESLTGVAEHFEIIHCSPGVVYRALK
ncbi:MAG: protein-glutamate O-methyltransferase CheR [Cellvibrionaceae bacterium]|nr:protein-glutamate O-methyltransferase CheR [Cellvibrionaceae bacterium]